MKYFLLIIIFCFVKSFSSQSFTFYVKPNNIDTNYTLSQDSHAIIIDTNVIFNNKIFLFIGGTGSSTNQYVALMDHAASMGFAVVNISYVNNIAANSLKSNIDTTAFEKYRQEICFGTSSSPHVAVDTLNSIYCRFLKLLNFLDSTNNYYNWSQHLLTSSQINWSNIAIGGHSQGSGHAAYFGKAFSIDRVLMFSGPNDYSEYFSRPALWFSYSKATSLNKYFSYLSLNDEVVPYWKQYTNIGGIGLLAADDSTLIDQINPPFNNSNCLYTIQSPGLVILHHNTPIKNSSKNKDVWTYMLTHNLITSIKRIDSNPINIFPNPATTSITISGIKKNREVKLFNLQGKLVKKYRLQYDNFINIEELTSGYYLININNKRLKFLKI